MRPIHLPRLALLLCLLIAAGASACGNGASGGPSTPPPTATATPVPPTPTLFRIPTATVRVRPTRTPTVLVPSATPTVTPTPTQTPTRFVDTYPHKQAWLRYLHSSGDHSMYEANLGYFNFPDLVLYTDGQLIVQGYRQPLQTKILSPDEICNLFITLDTLGLARVKTNGSGDLDDPIYQDTAGLSKVYDAGGTTLIINGRTLARYFVYNPYKSRAVKPILDVFAFLDHYTPANLQPYHADRLAVYVERGLDEYSRFSPDAAQRTPIPWPADATPLSQNDHGDLFLEGQAAAEVFDLTGGYSSGDGVFSDQVVVYAVYVRTLPPDEWRDYSSGPFDLSTPFAPGFSCQGGVLK